MAINKEDCVHRTTNGGIISWCKLKNDFCTLNQYCKDYQIQKKQSGLNDF